MKVKREMGRLENLDFQGLVRFLELSPSDYPFIRLSKIDLFIPEASLNRPPV